MEFGYEFAALTMISLKGNRTSRLVQGLIRKEWNGRFILDTHSWVASGGKRYTLNQELFDSIMAP